MLIRNGVARDGLEIVLEALPSSYPALDPPMEVMIKRKLRY